MIVTVYSFKWVKNYKLIMFGLRLIAVSWKNKKGLDFQPSSPSHAQSFLNILSRIYLLLCPAKTWQITTILKVNCCFYILSLFFLDEITDFKAKSKENRQKSFSLNHFYMKCKTQSPLLSSLHHITFLLEFSSHFPLLLDLNIA